MTFWVIHKNIFLLLQTTCTYVILIYMKRKRTIEEVARAAANARWDGKSDEEKSKIMSVVRRKGIKNSKKKS